MHGKAARIAKQMLQNHLEVSRILKKISNTKAAVELMLSPDATGVAKVNKKLFPVCSTLQEFSDSSSEEEKMLVKALRKASLKEDTLAAGPPHSLSLNLEGTRRGLLESF